MPTSNRAEASTIEVSRMQSCLDAFALGISETISPVLWCSTNQAGTNESETSEGSAWTQNMRTSANPTLGSAVLWEHLGEFLCALTPMTNILERPP